MNFVEKKSVSALDCAHPDRRELPMLEANCIPQTTPLTDHFGVEVHDFDLTQVRTADDFRAVRGLFDKHSAMLFRNQNLTDEDHIRLNKFFGSVEDRLADECKPGEAYKVPEVSNIREDGTVADEADLHTFLTSTLYFAKLKFLGQISHKYLNVSHNIGLRPYRYWARLRAARAKFPCAVERRFHLAGANPARQLMLQPAAIGAGHGGNDMD